MEHHGVSPSGLWALLLAAAALMGSPGPSTMSATAVGAAFGLRRSFRYVLGLIGGTILVLLAVATGVSAVLLSVPRLAPALAAASAAYILLLAVRIARAPPLPRGDPAAPTPSLVGGLLLAAANPKAYVAIGAVFAGSTLGAPSPLGETALKTAILAAVVVVVHLGWLLAGAWLSRVLRDPLASRVANLVLAAVLVATSALALLPW